MQLTCKVHNYVFKSTEASMMARYVDFGFSIGAGESFSLPNYYRLCDEIVEAIREHDSLLKMYHKKLDDGDYYYDESLHLLAFDFIYCCRAYNFYRGIILPTSKGARSDATKKKEAERQAKIDNLAQEIAELERSCEGCEDISLIGVEVSTDAYGTGVIVRQDVNKITVQYDKEENPISWIKSIPLVPALKMMNR